MVLGHYRAVRVELSCYWVSMKRNWLINDIIGSIKGGTGKYLLVLGQDGAVLAGTW